MTAKKAEHRQRRRRPWGALLTIALTALACIAALVFRTPLQARYWAWRLEHAEDAAERGAYLSALCNAGDAARWPIAALLESDNSEARQFGVLALHHLKQPWARQRLFDLLTDPDPTVQHLAAVGLAIHGDDAVIPALKWHYITGATQAAVTACLAFEHLGTPEAIVAMNELALEPGDPERRAALVDALEYVGTPGCVPALLKLLTDHRLCDTPRRSEQVSRRVLRDLQRAGHAAWPASLPATAEAPRTIAERAAASLCRITGLDVPFSSDAPPEQHARARQQWAAWYARQQESE